MVSLRTRPYSILQYLLLLRSNFLQQISLIDPFILFIYFTC